jgi:hypothetical protein
MMKLIAVMDEGQLLVRSSSGVVETVTLVDVDSDHPLVADVDSFRLGILVGRLSDHDSL